MKVLSTEMPERNFDYLLNQRGMFSYTGLSAAQVDRLREEFGVYLIASGRMCVAGLNTLQGQVKLLLTTYFEGVTPNLDTITALPVQGLHVDLVHGKDDVADPIAKDYREFLLHQTLQAINPLQRLTRSQ